MSVKDNLAFPLRSPTLNFSEADIKSKVNEVAEVLQIKDKLKTVLQLFLVEMQRDYWASSCTKPFNFFDG